MKTSLLVIFQTISFWLWGQQYASVSISTTPALDLNMYGESKVSEALLNESVLTLIESNANLITGLEIIWREYGMTDVATIKMVNAADANEYYGYELDNSSLFIKDIYGEIPLGDDFTPDDEFNVIRCNGKVYYLINNKIIAVRDNVSDAANLHSRVDAQDAQNVKLYVETIYPLLCNYSLGIVEEDVIILEQLRNYGVFRITGEEFKIKYYEKYADAVSQINVSFRPSNPLNFSTNFSFTNEYGLNIRTINISTLAPGEYWVEVKGMNKGESYQFQVVVE